MTLPRNARYLDATATLERYREQLGIDQSALAQYHKIRTVLINERYLCGTAQEVELAKKLILIDSKGVDATSMGGGEVDTERGLRYMEKEIKVMQLLSKMSNLTLFMVRRGGAAVCAGGP